MNFEQYNEDYGRNEFGNQFEKEATQMTALQSLLLGNELTEEELPLIREFKIVQEFLDLPMNDKKEAILKKAFVATICIAKEKGILPFEIPNSPISIASAVDDGLTRLKISYQTAMGKLDSIEATDVLIDHVAIRIITIVDKVIEKGIPIVFDKLCIAISRAYPKATVIATVIKKAEPYVTAATKVAVKKGIGKLAQAAKPIVQQVAAKVKSMATQVLKLLNSYNI